MSVYVQLGRSFCSPRLRLSGIGIVIELEISASIGREFTRHRSQSHSGTFALLAGPYSFTSRKMTDGAVRPVLVAARSPPPDTRPRICRPVSPRSLPPTSGPLFRSRFSRVPPSEPQSTLILWRHVSSRRRHRRWVSAASSFCQSSSTGFSITVAPVTVVVARHVVAIGRCSRAQSSGRVSLTFPSSSAALPWPSLLSPPRSCVVFDVVASAVAAVSPSLRRPSLVAVPGVMVTLTASPPGGS